MKPQQPPVLFSVSPEDWATWSQEFQAETDRGLAASAAAVLDHLLARLIEAFLVEDVNATKRLLGDPFSPLGSFAARTAAAFSLGLISTDEKDDLDCIRDIRNQFVHDTRSPSFASPAISQRVDRLKTPTLMQKAFPSRTTATSRESFRVAATMLSTFINKRTGGTQRRLRPRRFVIKAVRRHH